MDDRNPQSSSRRRSNPEKLKPSKPAFLSSSSRFLDGGAASRRQPGSAAVVASKKAAALRPSVSSTPISQNRSNGGGQALGRSPLSGAAAQPVSRRTRRNLPGGAAGTSGGANSCSSLLSPSVRSPPAPRHRYFPTSTSSSSASSSSSTSSSRFAQRSNNRETHSRSTPLSRPLPQIPFHGRRLNMEGIAEMLLALERIDQDDLTYEQLMTLEGNLLMAGISFRDQHRDLRMDIDDMSYEELLALEEEMGTVSTALPEEALTRCLQRSIFRSPLNVDFGGIIFDLKCSVCQEEYVKGEEIGKLHCGHVYHVGCVQQWLRLKNWCPICKSPACPS